MHKVIATEAGEKTVHQSSFTQDGFYLASYLQHIVTEAYHTWGEKAGKSRLSVKTIFGPLDLEALKFSF